MNGFFQPICHKKELNVCFKLIPHMCKLVFMSGFCAELSVPTPIPETSFFHHAVVQKCSETQISLKLFSWEHLKYQNSHPGAHFGIGLGELCGGGEPGNSFRANMVAIRFGVFPSRHNYTWYLYFYIPVRRLISCTIICHFIVAFNSAYSVTLMKLTTL